MVWLSFNGRRCCCILQRLLLSTVTLTGKEINYILNIYETISNDILGLSTNILYAR